MHGTGKVRGKVNLTFRHYPHKDAPATLGFSAPPSSPNSVPKLPFFLLECSSPWTFASLTSWHQTSPPPRGFSDHPRGCGLPPPGQSLFHFPPTVFTVGWPLMLCIVPRLVVCSLCLQGFSVSLPVSPLPGPMPRRIWGSNKCLLVNEYIDGRTDEWVVGWMDGCNRLSTGPQRGLVIAQGSYP